MTYILLVVLVVVLALGVWERERIAVRHADQLGEMQARIDALTVANSSSPETRQVYSPLRGREIPLRPASTWFDVKPTPAMRVVDESEAPVKKAGT